MTAPVLIVEDRRSLAAMLEETLRTDGFTVTVTYSGTAAVELLAAGQPFLAVLTDLKLPGADGLAVLRGARAADPLLPVFLMTGFATVDTAVAALKEGARDYFQKPLDLDRVLTALRAATAPRAALLANGGHKPGATRLIGTAPAFQHALTALARVAPTDAAVLLLGPSGSGKELFARRLHELSARTSGPFVAFNCAAVPESLIESELFGHERGAFTGATARHIGRFEQAQQGTLFLDEIGEVPPSTQSKLLRAVEDHRISRLGGEKDVVIDVRIVAATNRDLVAAVAAGEFRRDLFHRLAVFPLTLPALAERREDIPALAIHLAARAATRHGVPMPVLSCAALATLVLLDWPGNIRELANLIERVVILARGAGIVAGDLGVPPAACRSAFADPAARALARRVAGTELEDLARFLGVSIRAIGSGG